jgi:hypothetical protein
VVVVVLYELLLVVMVHVHTQDEKLHIIMVCMQGREIGKGG